jgi:hypothetical protein
MSYDIKCYKLAKAFLKDHPEKDTAFNAGFLAQRIQNEIEKTIEELKPDKDENRHD